jgi:ATP-dependent RNA helicase DHX37/DHR1
MVLEVDARQYPITTHFSRVTSIENYLDVAFKRVCQIHKKLPTGGILLFLTGKNEIQYMCKRLSKALGASGKSKRIAFQDDSDLSSGKDFDRFLTGLDGEEIESEHGCSSTDSSSDGNSDSGDEDDTAEHQRSVDEDEEVNPAALDDNAIDIRNRMLREALGLPIKADIPTTVAEKITLDPEEDLTNLPKHVKILPLYAALETSLQQRVFESAQDGTRLIIVATNVAETSITIPGTFIYKFNPPID